MLQLDDSASHRPLEISLRSLTGRRSYCTSAEPSMATNTAYPTVAPVQAPRPLIRRQACLLEACRYRARQVRPRRTSTAVTAGSDLPGALSHPWSGNANIFRTLRCSCPGPYTGDDHLAPADSSATGEDFAPHRAASIPAMRKIASDALVAGAESAILDFSENLLDRGIDLPAAGLDLALW